MNKLKVFVFGNEDLDIDNQALIVAENLSEKEEDVEFEIISPGDDIPLENGEDMVIMDVVDGIKDVKLIQNYEIENILFPPLNTAHDYDLGFQIKYLKKLGKIGKVTLIGLPMRGAINYSLVHSILRKLVEQDIHGS